VLAALRADYRTLRTAVSVIANGLNTLSADITVVAPAVVTHTVFAIATVDAQVVGTVATLFTTARADVCTLRAAVTVIADHFRAVDAGLAVQTEETLATCTVNTPITAFADFILGTVGAFLHAVLADYGTLIAARTTVADVIAVAADTAVFTPAVTTYAVPAVAAVGTDIATV